MLRINRLDEKDGAPTPLKLEALSLRINHDNDYLRLRVLLARLAHSL